MQNTIFDFFHKLVPFKKVIVKYSLVNVVVYILAITVTTALWINDTKLIHSIMELICIFIALSSFLLIWNSYKQTQDIFRRLGFGLLMIAVFDSFHTYLWLNNGAVATQYNELTIKFWVIGRLAEVFLILFVTILKKEIITNKWMKLFLFIACAITISLSILLYKDFLPAMIVGQHFTNTKIASGYVIIGTAIINLYNIKNRLWGEDGKVFLNIFIALLFIIATEMSFIINEEITKISALNGHLLKVFCYYYLYKAVYVCAIEYPHRKLEKACIEQEIANARIKEISDTMNSTLDALPVGILHYEPDKGVKYMNKQLEDMLACNRNVFFGLSLEDFIKHFIVEENNENAFIFSSESIKSKENQIRCYKSLKGEAIKLSFTTKDIGQGTFVYFDEVKRQQEMEHFNLQTQTILDAVSNAVLMINTNNKIIYNNEAFRKLFETQDIDLNGMDFDLFLFMIGQKGLSLSDVLLSNRLNCYSQEATVTTLKGNKVDILRYMAPITNVDNEITAAIFISTDITDIKKQQHYMQQQEKLAIIGQMATGIVHEIKNPLATIKGLSQLITMKSNVEKVKEYSSVINTAIDDVTDVVNEFLNFAKPKASGMTKTSINKIVESMQLITESQCYTKNIKSKFIYYSYPMEITADETKIKQVILNITENAIAAMEGVEAPELVVTTDYDYKAREGIVIIADNGIGMSNEVIQKLGMPFFTTKEKGTGLGLGISYQIISEHNGRIEVESEIEKGTEFKIIFTHIEDMI